MTYLIGGILWLCVVLPTVISEYSNLIPDSRIVIDYGPAATGKPVALVIYALPNGNSIEWTAGKRMEPGDDWHYDIQHIKAQTEFIRAADTAKHYIVAYLQASVKAWTTHSAIYAGEKSENNPQGLSSYILYPALVDTLERRVEVRTGRPVAEIILTSHSGGGRFMFNYITGLKEIPRKISRLAFIDSNYGFEDSLHTRKLAGWLERDTSHKLAVISYVDTTVILNGKPIVSRTGGTGSKTEAMYRALRSASGLDFTRTADTCFVRMRSSDGRVMILKKENPRGNIYHTLLVERNGFIHSLLFCTPQEEKNYKFWSEERAYGRYIRQTVVQ